MCEIARQLAEAENVEQVSAILAAADLPDLADLAEFARKTLAAPAYKIPGPYDIAMTFGAAALASGQFGNNVGAAMGAGWMAIPEFYMARDQYLTQLAPMFAPGFTYEGATDAGES